MLKFPLLFLILLSYPEWFFRTYEMQAVYPFDPEPVSVESAGLPGLTQRHLTAADGTELTLWDYPAQPGRPVILYLSGNAGNLLSRAGRFQELARRGYGITALAWRGSGGAAGKPGEAELTADALQVFDSFVQPPILYGESLGTAAAIKVAARRQARALVLESPFTSIPDLVAAQFLGENLRPYITQIWDSAAQIGAVEESLLVLHGTADRLVPITQGEAIFAAAGSPDKQMIRIVGSGHSGLWTPEVQLALYAFLDRF